jgi:hypothetical protein
MILLQLLHPWNIAMGMDMDMFCDLNKAGFSRFIMLCFVLFSLVCTTLDGFSTTTSKLRNHRTKIVSKPLVNWGFRELALDSSLAKNVMDNLDANGNATAIALQFKRRAQELRAEAAILELALKVKKVKQAQEKTSELYSWMKELFIDNQRPLTADSVADVIRSQNYSENQLFALMDALYQKQKTLNQETEEKSTFGSDSVASTSGVTNTTTLAFIQLLLDAALIVDEAPANNSSRWSGRVNAKLKSQLKDLNRREEAELQRHIAMSKAAVKAPPQKVRKEQVKSTSGHRRTSDSYRAPLWLPESLALHINATAPMPLDKTDILTIQNSILTRTKFFCTSMEAIPHAAIFRGNMRSRSSASRTDKGERSVSQNDISSEVFAELQDELYKEGLGDRIRLFFLHDPAWRPSPSAPHAQTVVVAIPKKPISWPKQVSSLSVAACFMTAFSMVGFGVKKYALNPSFYESIVLKHDDSVVASCFPLLFGLLCIHAAHELGHQLAAMKHKLRLSWPVPVPSFHYGTYGCITKLRSFPADQRASFDFAMSGPIASFALSIIFMVVGCNRSVNAPLDVLRRYPYVLPGEVRSSFLASSVLAKCIPRAMNIPLSQPMPLHPLFVAGWYGLIVSALNLLPILRLDGGRGCNAVLGGRISALVTSWTLLTCISLGSSTTLWAILAVLLQRQTDAPPLNDVTPLPPWRNVAWYAAMTGTAMTLLPYPGALLGI